MTLPWRYRHDHLPPLHSFLREESCNCLINLKMYMKIHTLECLAFSAVHKKAWVKLIFHWLGFLMSVSVCVETIIFWLPFKWFDGRWRNERFFVCFLWWKTLSYSLTGGNMSPVNSFAIQSNSSEKNSRSQCFKITQNVPFTYVEITTKVSNTGLQLRSANFLVSLDILGLKSKSYYEILTYWWHFKN